MHPPEMTYGFLIQLVFCIKMVTPFLSGAPPPKKNLDPPMRGYRGLPGDRGGYRGLNELQFVTTT